MINLPSIRSLFTGAACLGVAAILTTALARSFEPTAGCVGNERIIQLAMMQYVQDYDEEFPQMTSTAVFKADLLPYAHDPKVFNCPETGLAYVPNAALSYTSIAAVSDPSSVALVQDQTAHADGLKSIVYLDGTVTRGGVLQGDTTAICVSNVRRVSTAVLQYSQDYDEQFPPMDTPGHFRTAVTPYAPSRRFYLCPATNTWYQPNKTLSRTSVTSVASSSHTVLLSDDIAHSDGLKTVGYVDGHITRGTVISSTLPNASCSTDLGRISLAIEQYTQDNDLRLPPTDTVPHLSSALLPYLRGSDSSIFVCPDNHVNYVVNPAVSYQPLTSVDPSAPLLSDPAYNNDGTFNVVTAGGWLSQQVRYVATSYSTGPAGDGKVLWRNAYGGPLVYSIDAAGDKSASASLNYGAAPQSILENADGTSSLLSGGFSPQILTISPSLTVTNTVYLGAYDGWSVAGQGVGPNGISRLLWTKYDGSAAVWTLDASGNYVSDVRVGPFAGKSAVGFAVGHDNLARVLWSGTDGTASIVTVKADGTLSTSTYGPSSGYVPTELVVDSGNHTRILWVNSTGGASLWQVTSTSVTRQTNVSAPAGYKAMAASAGSDGLVRILFKRNDGLAKLYIVKNNGDLVDIKSYDTTI